MDREPGRSGNHTLNGLQFKISLSHFLLLPWDKYARFLGFPNPFIDEVRANKYVEEALLENSAGLYPENARLLF